jgi:glycolate oxidase iron-sulfur subunit
MDDEKDKNTAYNNRNLSLGERSEAKYIEDLDQCVKCGSCKALCPTYGYDLVEPMSARGRLMLLRGLFKGELEPTPLLNERLFSCLLCGMCETSCPAGVEITEAIYNGRARLFTSDVRRRKLRRIMRFVLRRPNLSFRVASLLRPLLPHLYRKGKVPFEINLPSEPLRTGLRVYKPKKARGRVAMFTGCAVNFLRPHLGDSLIYVLLESGYEVVLPGKEVCCGAPLRAAGLEEEAKRLAERNIEAFSGLKAEAVLSLCPTCVLTLQQHYPVLAGEGIQRTMDVSEFLSDKVDLPKVPNGGSVFYHDPCHLSHGLGIKEQPRVILTKMGCEIIKPEMERCCGFSLGFTHNEISTGLLVQMDEELRRAETVVTACPGCMEQLGRSHNRVRHIIELMESALETRHMGLKGIVKSYNIAEGA